MYVAFQTSAMLRQYYIRSTVNIHEDFYEYTIECGENLRMKTCFRPSLIAIFNFWVVVSLCRHVQPINNMYAPEIFLRPFLTAQKYLPSCPEVCQIKGATTGTFEMLIIGEKKYYSLARSKNMHCKDKA